MRAGVRGFAAAAVPGLVSAGITRALMRAVALLANSEPTFSPGALILIALIYIVALLPGCLALASSRARWPWVLFVGGVAFLGFEAVVIGVQETEDAHNLTPARWVALVLVLAAMLATYAAQAVVAARWARRGLPGLVGGSARGTSKGPSGGPAGGSPTRPTG